MYNQLMNTSITQFLNRASVSTLRGILVRFLKGRFISALSTLTNNLQITEALFRIAVICVEGFFSPLKVLSVTQQFLEMQVSSLSFSQFAKRCITGTSRIQHPVYQLNTLIWILSLMSQYIAWSSSLNLFILSRKVYISCGKDSV